MHPSPLKGSPLSSRPVGTFRAASAVIRTINRLEVKMGVIRGLFGAIVMAGLSFSAFAQAPPGGTYQQSCGNIQMQGTTLTAVCRTTDGRGVQTALDVGQCVGDIGNNNGQLQCNGGQPPAYSGPGYPPSYGTAPRPGYSSPGPGYSPPGYGPPSRY